MNYSVAAIIPTFKRDYALDDALKSVSEQTYMLDEVIVVNDNTDDDYSKKVYCIVGKYKNKLPVKLINSNSAGGSEARNIGARSAKSDLLAFLDDDDYWYSQKIELQRNHIIYCSKNCVAVFTQQTHVYSDYNDKKRISGKLPESSEELLYRNRMPGTPTLMIKKSIFIELGGFDKRLKARQDRDLWLRLLNNYYVCIIKRPLVIVNTAIGERESITRSNNRIIGIRQFCYKWRKHPALNDNIKLKKQFWHSHYSSLSYAYRSMGENKKARFFLLKAMKHEKQLIDAIKFIYYITGFRSGYFGKLWLVFSGKNERF